MAKTTGRIGGREKARLDPKNGKWGSQALGNDEGSFWGGGVHQTKPTSRPRKLKSGGA